MLKNILFIKLLLFLSVPVLGQFHFGIIDDKDGFVFVRSSKNLGNNIIDTLKSNTLIEYFDFEDGEKWLQVEYPKCKIFGESYVYIDRIKAIDSFEKFNIKKVSSNQVILELGKMAIIIVSKKFDKTKHSISFDKSQQVPNIIHIDNMPVYGIAENIPSIEYKSINYKNVTTNLTIPLKYLQNLFQPNLDLTRAYFDSKSNRVYIEAFNSDGAYGYVVLWVIENNKLIDFQFGTPF